MHLKYRDKWGGKCKSISPKAQNIKTEWDFFCVCVEGAITKPIAIFAICFYSPGLTLQGPHMQVPGDVCASCSVFGSVMKTFEED